MKTLSIDRATLDTAARHIFSTRIVLPPARLEPVAAIERQLDEIQHTFGAGWEW